MSAVIKNRMIEVQPPAKAEARLELLPLSQYLKTAVPANDGVLSLGHALDRCRYFRATKLIEFMVNPENKKYGLDKITTEAEAIALCQQLFSLNIFINVEELHEENSTHTKRHSGLRMFSPVLDIKDPRSQTFSVGSKDRYVWWLVEDKAASKLKLFLFIGLILGVTLYKVWPPFVRVIIWYISVTFLLLLLGAIVAQLVVFGLCWLLGYEVWILPNLWADELSILFKPLYTYQKVDNSGVWGRIIFVLMLLGLSYWIKTQPDEIRAMFETQKQIVEDLYSGKLLSDGYGPGSIEASGSTYEAYSPFGKRYGSRRTTIPKFEDIETLTKDAEDAEEENHEAPNLSQIIDDAIDKDEDEDEDEDDEI